MEKQYRKPRLEAIDYDKNSFPRDVILETSAYCNLKCIMCPYPGLKRSKGEMDFEIFKKIVHEIVQENPFSRLWIAIMGEPFMRGNSLIKMLRYARNAGLENIHVNTNATYLSEEMTDKLRDCDIKELLVSLDASTKETYNRIRLGGEFDTVIRNVEYFLKK